LVEYIRVMDGAAQQRAKYLAHVTEAASSLGIG
jgi:hypothetical protein